MKLLAPSTGSWKCAPWTESTSWGWLNCAASCRGWSGEVRTPCLAAAASRGAWRKRRRPQRITWPESLFSAVTADRNVRSLESCPSLLCFTVDHRICALPTRLMPAAKKARAHLTARPCRGSSISRCRLASCGYRLSRSSASFFFTNNYRPRSKGRKAVSSISNFLTDR